MAAIRIAVISTLLFAGTNTSFAQEAGFSVTATDVWPASQSTADRTNAALDGSAKSTSAFDIEAEIADLKQQIQELKQANKKAETPKTRTESKQCGVDKVFREVPIVAEREQTSDCGTEPNTKPFKLRYMADYDNGFLITPFDAKQDPFQLKINAWTQFRHVAFSRDEATWTDNAGVTRNIRNRNAFDVERARLTFAGFAVDKRLTYFLQLDGDTDGREGVDFFDYWWAWKFSDALRVQVGKRKVSSSRRWLMGARDSRFIDRPMATDFFRPDRTTGIWATGKVADNVFYETTVGNGFRTANRNAAEINEKFTFATTAWWDIFGSFGKSLTDHAMSESLLARVGYSVAYSPNSGLSGGSPLRETDFNRLSDGTRLTQIGALTPGVTVSSFDQLFYAVDFGMKYDGWSFSSEFYYRRIENLGGDGVLSVSDLDTTGFFVEGGRVICPNSLDWNVRYSHVNGEYGDASEYSAGVNWYPLESNKWKLTFDVARYDGSPLNNTASEILVGDSGTLFRTQVQCQF